MIETAGRRQPDLQQGIQALIGPQSFGKQVKYLTTTEVKFVHLLCPSHQDFTLNESHQGNTAGKSQQRCKQQDEAGQAFHRCGEECSPSTCRFKMAEFMYCQKMVILQQFVLLINTKVPRHK